MIQTSARLLQLLSLLQVRREWTGPALAERMQVTERTIRRDVDKLLGYPIHASPGMAAGYQLGAGAKLPPLLLDDNEAADCTILRGGWDRLEYPAAHLASLDLDFEILEPEEFKGYPSDLLTAWRGQPRA